MEPQSTLTTPPCRSHKTNAAQALRAPARLIADNAGVEGDVIVEKLLGKAFEVGYDAMNDKICDLLEAVRGDAGPRGAGRVVGLLGHLLHGHDKMCDVTKSGARQHHRRVLGTHRRRRRAHPHNTPTANHLHVQGVLDPAKVTRSGLQNSIGVAGIMLTTQAVMVEAVKPRAGQSQGRAKENPGFSQSGMPAGLSI